MSKHRDPCNIPAMCILLAANILSVVHAGSCHFATRYSCNNFLQNGTAVDEFIMAVMAAEGDGFHQPNVGYEPTTGYTFDGHPLNYTDGTLTGTPHPFSAPSKESLHVGMLALAVAGNKYALRFTGGYDQAISLLATKISTYEKFNASFPGYGCFMPWVAVSAAGIVPNSDWVGRVPGLDNGEWAWALFAAARALKTAGESTLATQYENYFFCLANNAKTIFYMGNGTVSSVVLIHNMTGAVTPDNYNQSTGGYLNDPYEGETLTVLLDLFAKWEDPNERELLWLQKRPLLQAVNYTTSALNADITVQKGWWFSAHEQWKTMMLPYFDIPRVQTIFANCERARTLDAQLSEIPGLFASVNDVTSGSTVIPDYIGATGIASIAFEPIERRDVVTPYGAWAVVLNNLPVGLCWYRNMLAAPRMQGPHGSTEAISINGTEISPLTTWDSKITTVLAMAGGLAQLNRDALKTYPTATGTGTAYERFSTVVYREYLLAFPFVVGQNIGYGIPSVAVPTALSPWSSCT